MTFKLSTRLTALALTIIWTFGLMPVASAEKTYTHESCTYKVKATYYTNWVWGQTTEDDLDCYQGGDNVMVKTKYLAGWLTPPTWITLPCVDISQNIAVCNLLLADSGPISGAKASGAAKANTWSSWTPWVS